MSIQKPERSKQADQSMLMNLLGMFDDEKFVKEMLDAHAPDEGESDVQSLFVLVENTPKGATGIVDCVVNPKADFWWLAQVQPSDQPGQSIAILKGLYAITNLIDQTKIQVFGVLNDIIKTELDMTGCIVEFEQESKDVPELSTTIDISTSVTEIIISILARSIQFTSLTSMVDEYINHGKERICCLHLLARLRLIEVLRRKNVLLLISDLKLASSDLSILVNVYNECKFQESQYDIMWVPIVDQAEFSEDMLNQFENLQSQMPWCSEHYPTLINKVAIKITKKKWHFRQEAITVVLGPQGGFALFTEGSQVVINATLMAVFKVVSHYDAWKKQVHLNGQRFEAALIKDQYNKIVTPVMCHYFYFSNMVGYIPGIIKCPVCPHIMRNMVMCECCHGVHREMCVVWRINVVEGCLVSCESRCYGNYLGSSAFSMVIYEYE
ncbi:hypothetical protein CRG98_023165 [Punica granatum]|uniref:Uncharacterized protein n=1 Tax=Punica granatum TaxID=22663 RepID=A0A2I0JJJ2_PUNGR|nr:hypothetical protein CRG98_023165 [Punica granatum]